LFFEHVCYTTKAARRRILAALRQSGSGAARTDVTILTYSRMRHHAMQAVKTLEKNGFDPEVIDLISLKPLTLKQSLPQCVKLE